MHIFRKATVISFVLGGCLLGGVVSLHADNDRAECERRIHNAAYKYHRAVRRHGAHSPQAEARKAELKTVRAECHVVHHVD